MADDGRDCRNITTNDSDASLKNHPSYSQGGGLSYENLVEKIETQEVEIKNITKRAEKAERLLEKANSYNEELKKEITTLSAELHEFRSLKRNSKNFLIQVCEDDIETAYGDKPMPSWDSRETQENITQSIAESLKAAAEEVIQAQYCEPKGDDSSCQQTQVSSDYVYDNQTGFYYHPDSGYYWDPGSQLFYDYTSGTYYQYIESSGEYVVHSQVDINAGSTEQMAAQEKETKSQGKVTMNEYKRKRKKIKKLKKTNNDLAEDSDSDVIIIEGDGGDDACVKVDHTHKRNKKSKPSSNSKSSKLQEKHTDSHPNKNLKECIIDVSKDDKENTNNNGEDKDVESSSESGSLATGESELVSSPESDELSDEDDPDDGQDRSSSHTGGISDVIMKEPEIYTIDYELAENHPPCIRMIVMKSEHLPLGSLNIITCAGGTIGREPGLGHTLEICDVGISKMHASVEYDYDQGSYYITDQGSQNGTKVNNVLLSKSKQASSPCQLKHGDVLELGSTSLLLHIHSGHDTCEECEPGQVQARLKAENPIKNDHVVQTKAERNKQRLKELKQIKKKFGLQNSYFENGGSSCLSSEYSDKAHLRRKHVGSEPDMSSSTASSKEMPASVQSPISTSNKGYKLLAKMGWKDGEGLGKDNSGIAEPINVGLRVDQNAGLGSAEGVSLSLDDVHKSAKAKRWAQARRIYTKLEAQRAPDNANHTNISSDNSSNNSKYGRISWQKSKDEYPDLATSSLPPSSNPTISDLGVNILNTGYASITPAVTNNGDVGPITLQQDTTTTTKKYASTPKISWVKGATQRQPGDVSKISEDVKDNT